MVATGTRHPGFRVEARISADMTAAASKATARVNKKGEHYIRLEFAIVFNFASNNLIAHTEWKEKVSVSFRAPVGSN